jgi:hypothetical protein
MRGKYPELKPTYTEEELIENFLLDENEQKFVSQFRLAVNRQAVAVILKVVQYLGYFPEEKKEINESIRLFIAKQLGLLWDQMDDYLWQSSTRDYHFAAIRDYTNLKLPNAEDKKNLEIWLYQQASENITEEALLECAFRQLKNLSVEVPAEKELLRIVNAALNKFFQDLYQKISDSLSLKSRQELDKLLEIKEESPFSVFDFLKKDADQASVKSLQNEVEKLQVLKKTELNSQILSGVNWKILKLLKRRAKNETASEMQKHPETVRYALLGSFVEVRTKEVIDAITQMALDIIHKVDKRSDEQLNRELLADIKKVEGKMQILFRLAEIIVKNPNALIKDVIFPEVKEGRIYRIGE